MNLLFVSNLFPSQDEPFRGLDNATLLPYLHGAGIKTTRVLALRPTLNPTRWGARNDLLPRPADSPLAPRFLGVPYLPKLGSRINHLLLERAAAPALDLLHRESPIDAVLVSWLFPDGCGIGRWCAKKNIPYVMICQGSDAHVYLRSPARRRLILSAVAASRAVITRSADLAHRLSHAGADPQKLHPVYNGIDPTVFHPGDQAAARAALGLPQNGSIALFVGNFLPVKNPLALVGAWRSLSRSRPFTLVMLGSGPLESEIRAAAADTPGLILPGRLPSPDIAQYMRAADVLCLSSHGEGVPNVVLEAFACGLPVLSTDVGGIREVLDHPSLGSLVPPGHPTAYASALATILDLPPDPSLIASSARRFSWQSTADAYAKVLAASIADPAE